MGLVLVQELLQSNAVNAEGVEWLTTTKEFLLFQAHVSVVTVEAASSKLHVLAAKAQELKCGHEK
jgi:hypothetical protein